MHTAIDSRVFEILCSVGACQASDAPPTYCAFFRSS
jgi:hypothetical protein